MGWAIDRRPYGQRHDRGKGGDSPAGRGGPPRDAANSASTPTGHAGRPGDRRIRSRPAGPRAAPTAPPETVIRLSRTWLLAPLAAALALLGAGPAAGAVPYVAIDPGHGGKETGAVGPIPPGTPTGLPPRVDDRGRTVLYEKDVNLDIALRLQAALTSIGARTLMTRTTDLGGGDRTWPTVRADLKSRTDIANEAGVDLFVSVHNNALRTTTSGTETFHYYYAGGASRRLAV
jgi:N-acetylmuramoyl-L-alanine amidase